MNIPSGHRLENQNNAKEMLERIEIARKKGCIVADAGWDCPKCGCKDRKHTLLPSGRLMSYEDPKELKREIKNGNYAKPFSEWRKSWPRDGVFKQ